MRCINGALIQKYIDLETSGKENEFINAHLKSCSSCAAKVEGMRQKANHIKHLTGLIDSGSLDIPLFKKPVILKKTFFQQYKHILFDASAACIIGLCLFLFRKPAVEVQFVMSYDLEGEYNANLPVSEQEMVINIIDSEGKLTQY
jgi:hypothetical protein